MRRFRLTAVLILTAAFVLGPAAAPAAAVDRAPRPTTLERAVRWLDDGLATLLATLFPRRPPAPKMAGEIDPNG